MLDGVGEQRLDLVVLILFVVVVDFLLVFLGINASLLSRALRASGRGRCSFLSNLVAKFGSAETAAA